MSLDPDESRDAEYRVLASRSRRLGPLLQAGGRRVGSFVTGWDTNKQKDGTPSPRRARLDVKIREIRCYLEKIISTMKRRKKKAGKESV